MNAMVSSPVDALVFDYVSFGFFTIVNNLWTWVAVFTAAVSFWRIRAGGVSFTVKSEPPASACIDSRNAPDPFPEASPREPLPSTGLPSSAAATAPSGLHENGVTKGKFVVYYREEDRESDGNSEDELAVSEVTLGGEFSWGDCWDRVLRVRNGDGGWYHYQDLTRINGNVVRLWDGVRREKYSLDFPVW